MKNGFKMTIRAAYLGYVCEDNHRAVLLDNASLLRVPGSPGTYKDGESEIAILHL